MKNVYLLLIAVGIMAITASSCSTTVKLAGNKDVYLFVPDSAQLNLKEVILSSKEKKTIKLICDTVIRPLNPRLVKINYLTFCNNRNEYLEYEYNINAHMKAIRVEFLKNLPSSVEVPKLGMVFNSHAEQAIKVYVVR